MPPPPLSPKTGMPPPLSLSTCWDKGKWHFDAPSFPPHLPRRTGCEHILAALRFLDDRKQLTAAGRDELAHAGEEIALLSEQVKVGARAFLDYSYQVYLGEMKDYGSAPPLHILETAWLIYSAKYDVSKRPRANAYQQLLLDHAYDRKADTLLRALDRVSGLAARLRSALADVPAADRSLIEAALAIRETDPVNLAESWCDPDALLHALRYLDPKRHALSRLRAALVLAERLPIGDAHDTCLTTMAYAVNLGATSEADAAWRTLAETEKRRLAETVNLLFAAGQEPHLALCAMRTVGNAESLKLIEQSVADKREGTTQYSAHRVEPSWEPVRRDARAAIRRRQAD
ncbi:MAG: hypothetical protein ABSD53_20310 [Terriglobales bacterium]